MSALNTTDAMKVLREAGIENLDKLARITASFLVTHPLRCLGGITDDALSDQEEAFLTAGGACGRGLKNTDAMNEVLSPIAAEYAQMVQTALTQQETAHRLGVSTSRVRQRIKDRTLFAVDAFFVEARVCPLFQFNDGATLPGFGIVLSSINPSAHPVAIQRFFLTPSSDLESKEVDRILCPRDWLISGHPPGPVITLAKEL